MSASFCKEQEALLLDTIDYLFSHADPGDWGQPLGLFYAVYRLCNAESDAVALKLGRFVAFYVASADLFDDVQDGDLAGKPHQFAGAPIATNSALTLLTLSLDALGEATELESDAHRRLKYFRLFNRVSLIAVAAQHQDLMGMEGAKTRAEVEHMHRGKTSSLALICECAALVGGADEKNCQRLYAVGEELAAAVQVIDDVRDLVAKDESVDLKTGKSTYPLACFQELADEGMRSRLRALLAEPVIQLDSVRVLIEQAGAFDQCAASVEAHRERIFDLLDESGLSGPHGNLLAKMVDQLASALYCPAPRELWERADAGLHSTNVLKHAEKYAARMRSVGFGATPALRSWHLPIFAYLPDQEAIYFSDLDGLSEEVLPFHGQLLALGLGRTSLFMQGCLPFLVAHEMTHAFRDQLGLLGDDAWHEEYVANAVALAYVEKFEPGAAKWALSASRRIVQKGSARGDVERRRQLLQNCRKESNLAQDYDCSPEEAAIIHAEMLIDIYPDLPPLEILISDWLKAPSTLAAE